MVSDIHDLTLQTLAYGGEALGHLDDGRAVFVPFALPGERVRVRLIEAKERYTRGELVEVLEPVPLRCPARCIHFGACGGCHYQHMPYEHQLIVKMAILRDQLIRIGHIDNPPMRPIVESAYPWNYRNHVQFHLTNEGRLGYVRGAHPPSTSRNILPITECHLPEEIINGLWSEIQFEPGCMLERVSIRSGTDGELMLILESESAKALEVEVEAGVSVIHVCDSDSIVMAGEGQITMRILERDFQVSAQSFFQVNSANVEKMVQHVLEHLPATPTTILDVYCGVGLFSAFLAPRCTKLIGIESSQTACNDFAANLDEFNHVELYEDLAERALPALNDQPDMILVDPPRSGLGMAALDSIVQMSPETLIYVSCEVSTLARDAARLVKAGYQLQQVTPFDLFPQTYHIESISFFCK